VKLSTRINTPLFALVILAVACTPIQQPGRIELNKTEFDFGTIPNTRPVSQTFQVRNAGQGTLKITGVSTSCGCTTAGLSSNVIPPGQRADLTVTFDADFHPTNGLVSRLVWFATNDPSQPWVEVRVIADVR
jgi:hypothetical protein